MKGNLTQKLSMIQARHCNSFNLGYVSINQSDKNFCICKSGDGKRNYTILLNSQCCDDWQCNLKCSNCKPCVPRYTCSCVDFLLYLYNMYIQPLQKKKWKEGQNLEANDCWRKQWQRWWIYSVNWNSERWNKVDLFLDISVMVESTDQRHFDAAKHVLKITVDVKEYFRNNEKKYWSWKVRSCHENCSRETFRAAKKIFSTAKWKRNNNVKYAGLALWNLANFLGF